MPSLPYSSSSYSKPGNIAPWWGYYSSYYCYDNPAALINQLQSRFRGTVVAANFDYDFQLLYSVYSLPNIALPPLYAALLNEAVRAL
mgnify:CR=1 FL=1